ncbi:MAG: hypothetical protein HY912_08225 [Desulfomonile tiedjei]|uniref:Uncharacterized protein n=1 Tax=Desulfomonile tiedjei TaxID=2358 RepID=A0A9D6Z349_9BACT|nr:hypothetical protein [Desulfomonile tiedjei]
MATLEDSLPYLQSFFQLNFLFSGLEVSSSTVLAARIAMFAVLGVGVLWAAFKIIVKVLDCFQTFFGVLGPLPKSFFLLLILVVPLSPDSIGARWIGYILLVAAMFGLACSGILLVILWKYGVDQALRLVKFFRPRSLEPVRSTEQCFSPDNMVINTGGVP